jgi:hypothetical protein
MRRPRLTILLLLTAGISAGGCAAASKGGPGACRDLGIVVRQSFADVGDDWEPSLTVGLNRSVVITATRRTGVQGTEEFRRQTVVWVSPNNGRSFKAPVVVAPDVKDQVDARAAISDSGDIYITWLGALGDSIQVSDSLHNGVMLATSRDGGESFRLQTIASITSGAVDKPELIISRSGTLFVAMQERIGPGLLSSQDGATWYKSRIALTDTMYSWPHALAEAPDGTLWLGLRVFPRAALTDSSTVATVSVMQSIDRGASWIRHVIGAWPRVRGGCAHDSNCEMKQPRFSVAVDQLGKVYVAYTEGHAGKPYRLMLITSENGGATWSDAQVISDASRNFSGDKADNDFPLIVTSGTKLYLIWTDDREGPLKVWAKRSCDGGRSWSGDVRLSESSGLVGYNGDYGGAAVDQKGTLHVTWADGSRRKNRPGVVWYARWGGR